MRSEQVHTAMAQGNSRFDICQLVSKGVRVTHKHGTRMEDSITQVLGMLGAEPAGPRHPSPAAPEDFEA